MERFPVGALVVTAAFVVEGTMHGGASLSTAESAVFYGLAGVLQPATQLAPISNAQPAIIFTAIVAMLFVILAFFETAIYIVLRKTTPSVRWAVRATLAAIAIALLVCTPPARPANVLDYGNRDAARTQAT